MREHNESTSLIGRLRSSTFRLSATAVSMSLTGSRFSSESAPGPLYGASFVKKFGSASLSVSTHAANHHEVRLVQLCFDFYMIEAKPKNLIGDRAYDGDALDQDLRQDGVEMIAPHRSNRKMRTQDGRRLRRYQRRWLVERFFAWIQWQRRILVRWEFYPENFLGFVQLACLVILLRQF